METKRKHASLVEVGEVVVEPGYIWLVVATGISFDGGQCLRSFNLADGTMAHEFFAAYDLVDVAC